MRPRPSQLGAAFALSLAGLWLIASAALAAYPPGPFPGPAPAGAFPTVLMSRTVCATGDTLLVVNGASNIRLEVPAGAFAECTQITIYGVDKSIVEHLLPPGSSVIDALAIGWSPDATPAAALTLTLTNSSIASAATAFQTTAGGVSHATDFNVSSGHVVASLSRPVGIVVAGQQNVEGATGQPSPSPLPSTDAGDAGGSPQLLLALALIALGVIASGGLIFARRSHQC